MNYLINCKSSTLSPFACGINMNTEASGSMKLFIGFSVFTLEELRQMMCFPCASSLKMGVVKSP